IYKPKGNIGNTFESCTIKNCDFGYFALGDYDDSACHKREMHAGCDRILGGNFEECSHAAIYVNGGGEEGYGQLIVDGTVIGTNHGFRILIRLSKTSVERMTTAAVELRSLWLEDTGGYWDENLPPKEKWIPTTNLTIEGIPYTRAYACYFEEVRSVMITG